MEESFLCTSLVQLPSINPKSQKAWGISSTNEIHPDAPSSSGQTDKKKKNSKTFLPVPPDQTRTPSTSKKDCDFSPDCVYRLV